jgi:hypothetical protein
LIIPLSSILSVCEPRRSEMGMNFDKTGKPITPTAPVQKVNMWAEYKKSVDSTKEKFKKNPDSKPTTKPEHVIAEKLNSFASHHNLFGDRKEKYVKDNADSLDIAKKLPNKIKEIVGKINDLEHTSGMTKEKAEKMFYKNLAIIYLI